MQHLSYRLTDLKLQSISDLYIDIKDLCSVNLLFGDKKIVKGQGKIPSEPYSLYFKDECELGQKSSTYILYYKHIDV